MIDFRGLVLEFAIIGIPWAIGTIVIVLGIIYGIYKLISWGIA